MPILCGSEGTLAGIFSAELNVVPLPAERGVGLLFFDSVTAAMQATEALLDLSPAAIEHIDRPLFDQTRGQREFKAVRALLDLDAQPCAAILIVEFFAGARDLLAQLEKRRLGQRQLMLKTPHEQNLVWAMRKAGLSLLTSRKGAAKPACFVEDSAVRRAICRPMSPGWRKSCRPQAWRPRFTATPPPDCSMCARCWICTGPAT